MIYRIFFLVFFVSFNLISCKQKPADEKVNILENKDSLDVQEAQINHSDNETPPIQQFNYQKITNSRYHFSFEIPQNWEAKNSSENGDGFFIECENKSVDIRIFASTLTGVQEIDIMETECDAMSSFEFKDKTIGKKCTQDGALYFYYESKKTRVTFYLNSPLDWKKENIEAINHIAESISMKQSI